MYRKPLFDCGKVKVSAREMDLDPLRVFAIVLKQHGTGAAKRLYDQWWETVPQFGAANLPLWSVASEMRVALA